MKIIFKDLKHGEIKLLPENLDDIWHLYNVIQPGDLVRAVTFRTDEQQTDKIRSKKTEKKRMKLGIRVEQVKFHEFSDRLRIHGIIEEGPQDLGSHHTLNITAEGPDALSIVKDEWKDFELERIEEAVARRKQTLITFVSLDEDTATIAVLRQSGIQWIADIHSNRSGKMYESQNTEKDYFREIISIVRPYKSEESLLVVIGPGFTRDHFVKFGKEYAPSLFQNCLVHGTGSAGMNGVQEAIRSGVVEHIARENRVVFETKLVDQLFEEIKKNGLAGYGVDEVEMLLRNGAVDRLLITDMLIRTETGENLLRLANQHNSTFTIINTMHDAGKKLEALGGVGALLRFKF